MTGVRPPDSHICHVLKCVADYFLHYDMIEYLEGLMKCTDPQVARHFQQAIKEDPVVHLKFLMQKARKLLCVFQQPDSEGGAGLKLDDEIHNSLKDVAIYSAFVVLPKGHSQKRYVELLEALKVADGSPEEALAACKSLDQWLKSVMQDFEKPQLSDLSCQQASQHVGSCDRRGLQAQQQSLASNAASSSMHQQSVPNGITNARGGTANEIAEWHAASVAAAAPRDMFELSPSSTEDSASQSAVGTRSPDNRNNHKRTAHQAEMNAPRVARSPPRRRPWTANEDRLLREAVRKCGVGKWADMCRHYPLLDKRGQVALKDRWRILSA